MRYPTLTIGHVESIASERVKGGDPSCDTLAIWRGDGETISFDLLDAVLTEARAQLERQGVDPSLTRDKEPFEGALAVSLYPALDAIDVEVLDDPGFWRYLAVSRFWWFVVWREAGPLSKGNILTYIDARRNTESIPLRLYLRAKAVAGSASPELAKELKECTDFWRSHVTRVRTGSAPDLSAAFAAMQRDVTTHLATNELRAFARRMTRLWSNVQLGLYDADMAQEIIEELRP